tara:strand:+ start:1301 stop:1549 length:249 start_codon:yes stop_codon:yes gene_type:complete
MASKYVDYYTEEDNEGNITFTDKELTLTSEAFILLTDDLEELIDKYANVEDWIENDKYYQRTNEIRQYLKDLIHDIVNSKED